MTRREKAAAAAATAGVGVLAAGAALGWGHSPPRPHAIGDPATAFGQQTPPLTPTTPPPRCQTAPGKLWGGVWHYSPAILHPTVLERYCFSYPPEGGTLVRVTVAAP